MTQRYGDMVQETISAPGTAAFTLGTPSAGYRAFSTIPSIASSDTVDYLAIDSSGTLWEIGTGTWTSGSLARTTIVLNSSGGTTAVNFTGSTLVSNTLTAERYMAGLGGGTGTVTSVAVSGGTTGLTTSGGPVTGSGTITLAGTLAVANGGTGGTTSTGSGAVVLATSPTLVTPALGTPSSATLTNATGLPISSGVSGLGAGVATALAAAPSGTGGVVLASSIPSASGQLLGGSGTAGAASAITVGSGLTLSAGTLTASGGGGGSGTVNSGSLNQVAYYASAGTAVSGVQGSLMLPMQSGRWYTHDYIGFGVGGGAGTNKISAHPLVVRNPVTITKLAAVLAAVSPASSDTLVLGIYSGSINAPTGATLLGSASVVVPASTAANTVLSATLGTAVALMPGEYFLAINQQTLISLYGPTGENFSHIGFSSTSNLATVVYNSSNTDVCYFINVNYTYTGSLPSTFPSGFSINNGSGGSVPPAIWVLVQ